MAYSRARFTCLTAISTMLLALPVAAQVELRADPYPVTTVALKRGDVPVRVSLGFDRALLLNLAPAKATGLKPFPIIGKFRVKNPQLPGGEALIRGNFISADVGGTGRDKIPTVWIDKDIVAPPEQGVVSILGFKGDRIGVTVAGAPAGGRPFSLVRSGTNDADMRWKVAGETVRTSMDLTYDRTVMSAKAAAALEAAGMVRRTGQVSLWSPIPGVRLPVEHLQPTAGATALGLPLISPSVRITQEQAKLLDARAASGISGMAQEDDDAIIVTAKKERGREGRRAWMLIGRDVLQYCSRIELDRPEKRWNLTCAFPG